MPVVGVVLAQLAVQLPSLFLWACQKSYSQLVVGSMMARWPSLSGLGVASWGMGTPASWRFGAQEAVRVTVFFWVVESAW